MILERKKENYHDRVQFVWVTDQCVVRINVVDDYPQFGEIHCLYTQWNKTAYMESLLDLEDIRKECAEKEINYLVALPDHQDRKKWQKYVTAMGFFKVEHDPMCYVMTTRE
jgi:hypothetical protein